MKKSKHNRFIFIIMSIMCMVSFNGIIINANEPIMEYRFTVEEQKIKRAQFIWRASIDELTKDNVLSQEDARNINEYISQEMKVKKNIGKLKRFDHEKNVLKVSSVDKMVKKNIISEEQGKMLRKKLNKYDISNLEN